ncbi:DNA-directed RNA polymerase subunit beta' [Candidatus Mycoplasma haematominutum]|uniref:Multifunctional fusion protein n=1 Tax=Candidatus Mycoplasma haematominutum 'Birmingham 1' TaxID=1116213 RepID=G8C3L0_9MOLU|nr:DNA-directed RNA polymerase subunit beta' [Candidatus Mycoplasma haematominutum]CCE66908.1 DNA-directed RNA polymerase, beta and beta' subunit [Candidatus Mycoplasma haematominutum 'Birmingham 1']
MDYSFKDVNSLVRRIDFSKFSSGELSPPNLRGIQIESYNQFLKQGIKDLIFRYFPLSSASGNTQLFLEEVLVKSPEETEEDAIDKSKSYQCSLYLKLKLVTRHDGKAAKTTHSKIFFGNLPVFSSSDNFIINGTEKFVISQIVRSPGLYALFKSHIRLSNSRKRSLEGIVCELLPVKGVLVLFHLSNEKNSDGAIKLVARTTSGMNAFTCPVSIFLKAFGVPHRALENIFSEHTELTRSLKQEMYNPEAIKGDQSFLAIMQEISHTKNLQKLRDFSRSWVKQTIYSLCIEYSELEKNANTSKKRELLDKIYIELAAKHIVSELAINPEVARREVYSYQELLFSYFLDKYYYLLHPAGRYKLNHKLSVWERMKNKYLAQDVLDKSGKLAFPAKTFFDFDTYSKFRELAMEGKLQIQHQFKPILTFDDAGNRYPEHRKEIIYEKVDIYSAGLDSEIITLVGTPYLPDQTPLYPADFLAIISYIIQLKHKIGEYDDIDNLGNKRLKLVDELLENKIILAMARMQKFSIDKMNSLEAKLNYYSLQDGELENYFSISSILNTKPFQIVIKEFFNSHQLVQFLDQQNVLSELTNKRKISAMGPGGIKREDPNLHIRDVHYSYYGRICPIETPEGMNIGLIMALAALSKVDKYGFINTPYFKVKGGVITKEIVWLSSIQERGFYIAAATTERDEKGRLKGPVTVRRDSDVETVEPEEVHFIDVDCSQMTSISTCLIPFMEHDDANRVLMGANMQRQAVPLVSPKSPIVATGAENRIARDSGVVVFAEGDGEITYRDSSILEVKYNSAKLGTKQYRLQKFHKSNQNTCKNQTLILKDSKTVKKGEILIDGHAMQNGELSLGQNILVAFTTWYGYNYEDAIILSSKLVQDNVYTSFHIQEYTVECMRTKIGDEEITRFIPGCLPEQKKYLDEDGIILVGAYVKEGDILVGKTSPKALGDITPEERLLQAIFAEKARSVKDSSLRLPSGTEGTVTRVLRYSRHKGDRLSDDVLETVKIYVTSKRNIQVGDKMVGRHGNKGIVSKIVPVEDMPYLEDGTPIDILLNPLGVPSRMNIGQILESYLAFSARRLVFKKVIDAYFSSELTELSSLFSRPKAELAVLNKVMKAYLTKKKIKTAEEAHRKLTQLDFSVILSQSGLKYDELEIKVLTPIFAGCKHLDLIKIMSDAGIDHEAHNGRFTLYDGKTGEKFKDPISVGIIYMLKLDHMVDDKIYARSVGPYSKITQQPLGGKCQNGGQRFGEMEVWAMEAYGAAYNLRELLTLKSDDIQARNMIYYSVIKGQALPTPGISESFKLLVKKLQALGLKVNIRYGAKKELIGFDEYLTKRVQNSEYLQSLTWSNQAVKDEKDFLKGYDMFFEEEGEPEDLSINGVQISITSPEYLLSLSRGEVKSSETINYKTFKPEKGGLFCEAIFGPVKDYECSCGKYKRVRFRGKYCEKCGVCITESIVRREWMGHISLACPIAHIWMIKELPLPSKISLMLGIKYKSIEEIVYFVSYVVIEVSDIGFNHQNLFQKSEIVNVSDQDSPLRSLYKLRRLLRLICEDIERKEPEGKEAMTYQQGRAYYKALAYSNLPFSLADVFEYIYKFSGIKISTGAEAIYELLKKVDLDSLEYALQKQLKKDSAGDELNYGDSRIKRTLARLEVVRWFKQSGNKPEWMILRNLLVLPPNLRPIVQLDAGRFTTSDLNLFYRRIIIRNERLKRILSLNVTSIIANNEKRMLQEAVDSLIDNASRKKPLVAKDKHLLKSLTDHLKGKQGLFRQNLLGKRVDYSGRSVVVVGPELKLHQTGLPILIVLKLFKPFIIRELIRTVTDEITGERTQLAPNIRIAEEMIENQSDVIWPIVHRVMRERPVLLNRAPTLHSLGIQAFEPVLVDGKAICLHPLVTTAFNADFDGDQMAVHLPLSDEAVKEARAMLLAPWHVLAPKNGQPILMPSQDMVLGLYYLTNTRKGVKGEGKLCSSQEEVIYLYRTGGLDLNAHIAIPTTAYAKKKWIKEGMIITTPGKVIFNSILPPDYRFVNESGGSFLSEEDIVPFGEKVDSKISAIEEKLPFNKGVIQTIIEEVFGAYPIEVTATMLDNIKSLGFEYSTKSCVTISPFDIPRFKDSFKSDLIEAAEAKVREQREFFELGMINDDERYQNVISLWNEVKDKVSDKVRDWFRSKEFRDNPMAIMERSGARGSLSNFVQLSGMRGLMNRSYNYGQNVDSEIVRDTIEVPIKHSFIEGLNMIEYFNSSYGSRKSMADTAVKTAKSGYMTRKLVDASQEVIVKELDCDTNRSLRVSAIKLEGSEKEIKTLEERIRNRCVYSEVVHPESGAVLCAKGEYITKEKAKAIVESGITSVEVRSPFTCFTEQGICQKCFGINLTTGAPVEVGTAIGVIAAQSVGEPATQLTMRTFHSGGVAGEHNITQGFERIKQIFDIVSPQKFQEAIITEISGTVKSVDKKGELNVVIVKNEKCTRKYEIDFRKPLLVSEGDNVKYGDRLSEGIIDLRKYLSIAGLDQVRQYMVEEILKVYWLQGIDLSDRYIELIVRQLTSKWKIIDAGASGWSVGDIVDDEKYRWNVKKLMLTKKAPPVAVPVLFGLEDVPSRSGSYLAAASFQDTRKNLIDAAVQSRTDELKHLKENIIVGNLIPSGTGHLLDWVVRERLIEGAFV